MTTTTLYRIEFTNDVLEPIPCDGGLLAAQIQVRAYFSWAVMQEQDGAILVWRDAFEWKAGWDHVARIVAVGDHS